MTATIPDGPAGQAPPAKDTFGGSTEADNPLASFALQVQVVPEAVSDDGLVPCGTGDGCGATCASACANSGV
ncbi:FxLD family lanthipeptide [Streptomonospora salina]|uniref:FxLD family lantipeptide n=1 Tax=Streptomonospora salina TaxID=104205 RepID=A0A841EFH8_9ACTN|nr:FxLD family lanthipeptide [Streptomonospora salina]MBB6000089.1 FxLD family lantipeptide [Streptomonospora salina]